MADAGTARSDGDRDGKRPRPTVAVAAVALLAGFTALLYWRNVSLLAFIGDDAFIAFRYSRNLVDGLGLVWNPGERVEGFTSFGWMALVAAGMAIGLDPELLSHAVGIASGVAIGATLVAWSRFAVASTTWIALVAPLLLASNRSFAGWSTGGLETQLFSLLVLLGMFRFVWECRSSPAPPWSAALFFAATLVRPEGLLFATVAGAFGLIDVVRDRRELHAWIRWALPYALLFAAFVSWRRWYFGHWLPNTFYAKVPGFWWEQGFVYLRTFASEYRIGWTLLPVALLLATRRRFDDALLTAALLLYTIYVASIGGDRFEFRFMVVTLPLHARLFARCVEEIAQHPRLAGVHRFAPAAAALTLALCGLYPGSLPRPAKVHAAVVPIGLEAIEHTADFAGRQRERARQLAQIVEQGLLPDDLRIAVRAAGVVPYFTNFYTVDMWGLNDEFVAHEVEPSSRTPAHRREAPRSYLEGKRIDMIEALDGFVRPFHEFPTQTHCRGPVRCLKAGPYILVFETTLGPDEFARRFERLQVVH